MDCGEPVKMAIFRVRIRALLVREGIRERGLGRDCLENWPEKGHVNFPL
jgi:hypothetical protein